MRVLFFSVDPPSMGSESSEEECWRKGSRRGGCRRKIVELSQKLQQASSHCASISLGASLLQPTLEAGTGGQSLHHSVHKTMVAGVHLKLVEFVKIEKYSIPSLADRLASACCQMVHGIHRARGPQQSQWPGWRDEPQENETSSSLSLLFLVLDHFTFW